MATFRLVSSSVILSTGRWRSCLGESVGLTLVRLCRLSVTEPPSLAFAAASAALVRIEMLRRSFSARPARVYSMNESASGPSSATVNGTFPIQLGDDDRTLAPLGLSQRDGELRPTLQRVGPPSGLNLSELGGNRGDG